MDQRERSADLLVPQGREPSGLGAMIVLDPSSDRVDHEHVSKPRDHGFSAGTQLSRFARHESERGLDPLAVG